MHHSSIKVPPTPCATVPEIDGTAGWMNTVRWLKEWHCVTHSVWITAVLEPQRCGRQPHHSDATTEALTVEGGGWGGSLLKEVAWGRTASLWVNSGYAQSIYSLITSEHWWRNKMSINHSNATNSVCLHACTYFCSHIILITRKQVFRRRFTAGGQFIYVHLDYTTTRYVTSQCLFSAGGTSFLHSHTPVIWKMSGWMGGSKKHQTLAQEDGVHVPCENRSQPWFICHFLSYFNPNHHLLLNLTKLFCCLNLSEMFPNAQNIRNNCS